MRGMSQFYNKMTASTDLSIDPLPKKGSLERLTHSFLLINLDWMINHIFSDQSLLFATLSWRVQGYWAPPRTGSCRGARSASRPESLRGGGQKPCALQRSEPSKNVAINQKITWLTHPVQINSTKKNALMLRLSFLSQNLKYCFAFGEYYLTNWFYTLSGVTTTLIFNYNKKQKTVSAPQGNRIGLKKVY